MSKPDLLGGISPFPQGEQVMAPNVTRSIAVDFDRDQVAAALLAYAEYQMGVAIPSKDVAFELFCHTDEDGKIERVEAQFMMHNPQATKQ